jgi:hypothetical protein
VGIKLRESPSSDYSCKITEGRRQCRELRDDDEGEEETDCGGRGRRGLAGTTIVALNVGGVWYCVTSSDFHVKVVYCGTSKNKDAGFCEQVDEHTGCIGGRFLI